MSDNLEKELGFSREQIEECLRREGLLSLELEFTTKCNLRCIYCYASAGEARDGELSPEEIIGVIRQAQALGAGKIVLLGGGEPLLFPHVREIMEFIHSAGLSQTVFTNGMLLTAETCRFLFDRRVRVVVKHNSFLPEVQDCLAGVPGAHRHIREGLRLLMEAGYPGRERLLGIQSVICRQNRDEIEAMWVWAREQGFTPYFEVLTSQGRARENPSLALFPGEIRDLFHRLAAIDRERFGNHWIPRPPIAAFTCRRHLYSCLVNSQGYVQPCTGIDLPAGNVRERPLAAILRESEAVRKLRAVHSHIDPACRTCVHGGDCYGCRGNAYQTTGDFLSPDPTCWMQG